MPFVVMGSPIVWTEKTRWGVCSGVLRPMEVRRVARTSTQDVVMRVPTRTVGGNRERPME
jgi:hypothetical protein